MLIRGVIDDEFGDDANAARMRGADKMAKVSQRAVIGVNFAIIADIIAVVEPRRRIERQQPDGVDAKVGNVIKL